MLKDKTKREKKKKETHPDRRWGSEGKAKESFRQRDDDDDDVDAEEMKRRWMTVEWVDKSNSP
jgi:hypothetical protein